MSLFQSKQNKNNIHELIIKINEARKYLVNVFILL